MSAATLTNRKLALCAIAALLAAATTRTWASSASLRGRADARRDIGKGIYKELIYGLPGPWNQNYALLLKNRYNVELRRVAGCIVTKRLTEYVRGYDEVGEAAGRRYGRDIFDETYREAGDQAQREMAEENGAPAPSLLPSMKD